MFVPRLVLALTILMVGGVVLVLTRSDERRVFLLDLGREVTDRDRARVRRTRIVTLVASLAGVLVAFLAQDPAATTLSALLAPYLPIAWMLGEMVGALKSAELGASPARFRVPLEAPPGVTAYVSLPLQLGSLGLMLLAPAAFWFVRSGLPDRVPLHFDATGRLNRWGNPDELWMMLGLMLFDYALMWMIAWGVARERWALPSEHAERYASAQLRRRRLMVRMVEAMMLGINASMATIWLSIAVGSLPGRASVLMAGVVAALVLMALAVLGTLIGFIGPLLAVQNEIKALAGSSVLGTKSDGWRWRGMIYYAPEDPAVFVPKRFGIGQTLNFARPGAWVFLAFALLVPVVLTWVGAAVSSH